MPRFVGAVVRLKSCQSVWVEDDKSRCAIYSDRSVNKKVRSSGDCSHFVQHRINAGFRKSDSPFNPVPRPIVLMDRETHFFIVNGSPMIRLVTPEAAVI